MWTIKACRKQIYKELYLIYHCGCRYILFQVLLLKKAESENKTFNFRKFNTLYLLTGK